MTDAIQKHIEHDYYVRVTGSKDGQGCNVEYPPNYFEEVFYGKYFYHLLEDGVEVYFTSDGEAKTEKFVVPKYARRIFILSDIFLKCLELDIHASLIKYFDSDGNSKKKITETVGQYDADSRELQLNTAYIDILSGNVDESKYASIKKGLKCISNLYEKGGIR